MKNSHNCPICMSEIAYFERYPNRVCSNCDQRTTDKKRRPVSFGNISISGGFIGVYSDNGERYESHTCYIDGIKCHAEEFRFGGIVVEVVKE